MYIIDILFVMNFAVTVIILRHLNMKELDSYEQTRQGTAVSLQPEAVLQIFSYEVEPISKLC